MTAGHYEITQEAKDAVLTLLSRCVDGREGYNVQWDDLADHILRAALPLITVVDPPTTQRQDELDGEQVLALRAQARAADLQAEHSQALARLVERSEELAELQAELTRRQLAEVGGVVNDYTLWRDALTIAAATMLEVDDTAHLELVARGIRESLRWAGNPPVENANETGASGE